MDELKNCTYFDKFYNNNISNNNKHLLIQQYKFCISETKNYTPL